MNYVLRNGLMGGYGNGIFGPNDNITREQLAVMLWRYAGSPVATDKELHFTDADKASGYALGHGERRHERRQPGPKGSFDTSAGGANAEQLYWKPGSKY